MALTDNPMSLTITGDTTIGAELELTGGTTPVFDNTLFAVGGSANVIGASGYPIQVSSTGSRNVINIPLNFLNTDSRYNNEIVGLASIYNDLGTYITVLYNHSCDDSVNMGTYLFPSVTWVKITDTGWEVIKRNLADTHANAQEGFKAYCYAPTSPVQYNNIVFYVDRIPHVNNNSSQRFLYYVDMNDVKAGNINEFMLEEPVEDLNIKYTGVYCGLYEGRRKALYTIHNKFTNSSFNFTFQNSELRIYDPDTKTLTTVEDLQNINATCAAQHDAYLYVGFANDSIYLEDDVYQFSKLEIYDIMVPDRPTFMVEISAVDMLGSGRYGYLQDICIISSDKVYLLLVRLREYTNGTITYDVHIVQTTTYYLQEGYILDTRKVHSMTVQAPSESYNVMDTIFRLKKLDDETVLLLTPSGVYPIDTTVDIDDSFFYSLIETPIPSPYTNNLNIFTTIDVIAKKNT